MHVGSSLQKRTTTELVFLRNPTSGAYVSPIGRLIDSFDVIYDKYADNTQLYTSLNPLTVSSLDRLTKCTAALQVWFSSKRPTTQPRQVRCRFLWNKSETLAGCSGLLSKRLKLLAVTIDNTLDFEDHVNGVVRTCSYHLPALRQFRHSLKCENANALACSIVGSLIDYCNALLIEAIDKLICKLQRGKSDWSVISAHDFYATLAELL